MNILQITVILVVFTGFGDDKFFGGGGGYDRCLYVPASRIVVNQSVVNIQVFWWIKCYCYNVEI